MQKNQENGDFQLSQSNAVAVGLANPPQFCITRNFISSTTMAPLMFNGRNRA